MASTNLEVIISARDQFTATANRVTGALDRMNASAGRVGRGVGQVAGGLSRLAFVAGGVAAAGLIASARAAISFEDAFAGVRKTADLTEAEFTDLAKSFRAMSTEIPISANELARLGETAGALGITGVANIREFSRVTALLGVTTDLTADEAASSLGHIATILQLTGKEYESFADALVNLGNKGASTESQIAGIAERAAGGAATIGLATNELLAWSAAIANIGVEVEAGGTNLQKFFIEATKFAAENGDELETLAKVSGVTAKQWKADFGTNPSSALSQFVLGLGKLNREQQVLALGILGWDDQRMARILLGLAANTDNLAAAMVNAGTASQGALGVEAQKRFDTLASKLTILRNTFFEAALTVGEGFTPALGRAAEKLRAFISLDTTKSDLRKLGADIGAALDDIDWAGVLEGAKTFVGLLKDAFTILNALPSQIKLGGAAMITAFNAPIIGPAFSQIGKGFGNIALGLLTGAGSLAGGKVGAVAGLIAQPVRVVNWPPGFGMGAGGLAGGAAGAAGGFLAPGVGALVAAAAVPFAMFYGIPAIVRALNPGGRGFNEQGAFTAGGGKVTGINAGIVRLYTPALPEVPGAAGNGAPPGVTGGATPSRSAIAANIDWKAIRDDLRNVGQRLQDLSTGGGGLATALVAGFEASTSPSLVSMQTHLAKIRELIPQTNDKRELAQLIAASAALQALVDRKLTELAAVTAALNLPGRIIAVGGWGSTSPTVNVTVPVTTRDVSGKTTVQGRVGPQGGSRERGVLE